MKRTAATAALLLLAACAMDPYADREPYGTPEPSPYPDAGPYPPTPDPTYPPTGPTYPPAPYPSPGPPYAGPLQPPPPDCPISASRDWSAWINAMPGPNARPKLIVTGKVVTATGGYQASFDPHLQIRESRPAQAFATLQVSPPAEGATQAVVTHNLRWEWPLSQPVGSLVVRCGDKTLAEITAIQTAY